jgi:hypothetical protein
VHPGERAPHTVAVGSMGQSNSTVRRFDFWDDGLKGRPLMSNLSCAAQMSSICDGRMRG